jgi:hypothetical protein
MYNKNITLNITIKLPFTSFILLDVLALDLNKIILGLGQNISQKKKICYTKLTSDILRHENA